MGRFHISGCMEEAGSSELPQSSLLRLDLPLQRDRLCVQLTNTLTMSTIQRQLASRMDAFVSGYQGWVSYEGDCEVG